MREIKGFKRQRGFIEWLPAIATVGSALFGGSSAKKAAKTQAKAAEEAGRYQLQAAQQSIAEQKRQFDIAQTNMQPWLKAGGRALGAMESALYGPPTSKYAKFVGSRGTPPSVAPPGGGINPMTGRRQVAGRGPSRRNFGSIQRYEA